jgi:hypothetical protein
MVLELLLEMQLKSSYHLIQIRESYQELIEKMVPRPRKIVEKIYYYVTDSDSDSESEEGDGHVARFVFPDGSDEEWLRSDSESESDSESDVSDSEDGSDYETEEEPESDSEELDEPTPYYGEGFHVYFDSHKDKKLFMKAFGFSDA